jgi:hypothetical protein
MNSPNSPSSFTGMSLDGIFLIHFLNALERLQIYLGESPDEESRWAKVNPQFEYLLALLPPDTQKKINKAVVDREAELRASGEVSGDYAPQIIGRMQIVTGIVVYLTNSLDLVHEDIIGALTPEARNQAIRSTEVINV